MLQKVNIKENKLVVDSCVLDILDSKETKLEIKDQEGRKCIVLKIEDNGFTIVGIKYLEGVLYADNEVEFMENSIVFGEDKKEKSIDFKTFSLLSNKVKNYL